jgi:N-acetylglutamate synthase-like GNAT family acetyltransferase
LPESRVKGIGKQLVEAFLAGMKDRGVKEVYLSTDAAGNDAVNEFYIKLGFRMRQTHTTPEGRTINEYYIRV